MSVSYVQAQTPGLNYQALILNNETIEIPGTDVQQNQVPLGNTEVTFRFTISNDDGTEYIEEQTVTTDENGLVSLIVSEGTPIQSTFDSIVWDGNPKYLNVDLNILSNNTGFTFLDSQRILYIPHPSSNTNSTNNVQIVSLISDLTPPYNDGELAWVENSDSNGNRGRTLMIYDGSKWVPVSGDNDPTDELGLVVVENNADRDTLYSIPIIGDQVWNKDCGCLEVYNGTNWVSLSSQPTISVSNGIANDNNVIKLGGALTEATEITTSATNTLAIKNLQNSTSTDDEIVTVDKNTGILKKRSLSDLSQKKQIIVKAIDGQLQFTTPLPITSIDKLDVYRNGVRISFSIIDSNTIEIETEAICYAGDEIRIVQLN